MAMFDANVDAPVMMIAMMMMMMTMMIMMVMMIVMVRMIKDDSVFELQKLVCSFITAILSKLLLGTQFV